MAHRVLSYGGDDTVGRAWQEEGRGILHRDEVEEEDSSEMEDVHSGYYSEQV